MKFFYAIFSLICSFQAYGFDYFDHHIDYWKQNNHQKETPIQPILTTKKEDKKFDWNKYKDPKNPEFFKEGEHTPPAPFMELARNPNDENIKQWFELIGYKNQLMSNLNRRIAEYVGKQTPSLSPEEKELISQKTEALKVAPTDFKRFRFRLYFDSVCPHCKNMMTTMTELQNQGFYLELKQIDKKPPDYPVPFPITPANEKELKEKKISSWPVLFVADTDKKLIYRINGYFSTQQILQQLSNK